MPRLPIDLDPVSNGEFFPEPMSEAIAQVKELAHRDAEAHARRKGMSRREFLMTSSGAATVLLAMNAVLGCNRSGAAPGGRYAIPASAALDEDEASAVLSGDELIFDVQTHHLSTTRDWQGHDDVFSAFLPGTEGARCGADPWVECFSRDQFIKQIFLDSDTDIAVLSMLAGTEAGIPLRQEEAIETRETANRMGSGLRLKVHGIVMPNLAPREEQLESMEAFAERWQVSAWKVYTIWGPDGSGFWLDDPRVGIPMIEQARRVGVPLIAIHKGLPLPNLDPTYTRCRDVGVVARMFPDVTFLIYHAGYEIDHREGPYRSGSRVGVDGLIRSLEENGVAPNANVAVDLGSTWRHLMKKPTEAAHVLGKLLKHVGEDNVLWGTDAIWYGSPQEQIQAFRAFEIAEALQEEHGYPALTPARRAKILGLNAARIYKVEVEAAKAALRADDLARAKVAYQENPRPSFVANGPRTRREVLELARRSGGFP